MLVINNLINLIREKTRNSSKFMNKSAITLSIILFSLMLNKLAGQIITNIEASPQYEEIYIRYDLLSSVPSALFSIELNVSLNGGGTFTGPLVKIKGDAGEKVSPGRDKLIVWDVISEFGEIKSDEVVFKLIGSQHIEFNVEFVKIEGRIFTMGSKKGQIDEKPMHRVELDEFYISKYEITQEQWFTIMGTNPSQNHSCHNCPVENVNYHDVNEFIIKLNAIKAGDYYRLPTEAEWEFVACGSQMKSQLIYAGSNNLNSVGWSNSNSDNMTHPVGQKAPNEFGCYDMSGNVQEWCHDYYSQTYYRSTPLKNPTGPKSGSTRVIRGGAYNMEGKHSNIRSRNFEDPQFRSSNLGFRIVKIDN